DGYVAPSALAAPGGKERVIEFGSLSKTYNMTGWRVGYAVGNRSAVSALATLKTNLDSGIFNAVQRAAVAALTGPQDHVERIRAVYRARRDVVVDGFRDVGVPLKPPLGSIYVWVPVPSGHTAESFAGELPELGRLTPWIAAPSHPSPRRGNPRSASGLSWWGWRRTAGRRSWTSSTPWPAPPAPPPSLGSSRRGPSRTRRRTSAGGSSQSCTASCTRATPRP